MRQPDTSQGAPEPTSEDERTARLREGIRAGGDAVGRGMRAAMAKLAATGLATGLTPQEPTGGAPDVASRRNDACYWCGVYLGRGTPCWRYEPDRQRHRPVAHPSCHADAMGEP